MGFMSVVFVLFTLVLILGLFATFYQPSSPKVESLSSITWLDEDGWEYVRGLKAGSYVYVNGPRKGQLL